MNEWGFVGQEISMGWDYPPDYLKFYTKGFKFGLESSGALEVLDSSDGVIRNVKTKTLKMNRNGKVKHVLFMKIDDYMYVITLAEITSDSAVEI